MKWEAGAYYRLSKENRYSLRDVSDSIENQRLITRAYLSAHPDITIVEEYIDDGYTGLNYDREGFERMKCDLENGRINTIITKDLSRLGREQVQTLQLVTLSFVEQQIRYIAIEDNYDSFINPDTTMIEMKAFMNNFYSADNSRKVRAVQRAKREKGEFIGSFAPYGYRKDPECRNHLIIDGPAAEVVRKIFDLYLDGNGLQRIARILNDENILPPTAYKQFIQESTYKNGRKYETTKYWTYSGVRRILTHEVYIGNMVQHTIEKISYKSEKKRAIPKKDQCIVKNTHEAIIDHDKFKLVQQMMKVKRRENPEAGEQSIFSGLFFCGDCGRRMCRHLYRPNKDGVKLVRYKCASYAQFGKNVCTIHSISEEDLRDIVLRAIRENAVKALKETNYDNIRKLGLKEKKDNNEALLARYEKEKCILEERTERMLMNLSDNVISKGDFLKFRQRNEDEIALIENRMDDLRNKIKDEGQYVNQHELWIRNFIEHKDITQLRREILVNLISRIEIYEDRHLEIEFRFRNPFED